ncbi:MAG: dihydroorotate dehydrogenase (quinone) [Candidatus Moraniibacteriota bacterium]|nr:MAG: dihydroorotate dehydrogenase (quinone) [Candidatus Moranbacteria bacterium]
MDDHRSMCGKRALFGWMYQRLLKPVLFRFPADDVHERFLAIGRSLGRSRSIRSMIAWLWRYDDQRLVQTVSGLVFPNPIGLSAGLDYRADLSALAPSLGFGFHSIGTLTLEPYAGNPRPMLDRLPKSRALLVNKGFRNEGIAAVLARIGPSADPRPPRGVSIGATNRPYPDFSALIADIVDGFRTAERFAGFDYYELNISCPNLVNLRDVKPEIGSPEGLSRLLAALSPVVLARPVFIKMPLERTEADMLALVDTARPHAFIKGLILSNLAKDRSNPAFDRAEIAKAGPGNFSGKPTQAQSNAMLRTLYRHCRGRFVLIGTGGVFTAEDAYAKILAGASLVQLVTGMIYEGPQVIGSINAGLAEYLVRDGYASVSDAVGARADRG